ncbi:nitrate- and nitrite sensing domain-containing protein [Nonomuraea sp. NPDC050540]|uniref:nitrate- and nitrite sensing domain-containing protein n=1 Tax=Nonomuraea sp. NPDC050540 TaxID=3364367 RepID=UPI0037A341F0
MLLAGVQLANAIGTSAEYRRLTQVAELVQRIGALSHEMGKERALTAWYIADQRRPSRMAQLRTQRAVVDGAKTKVLDSTAAIDDAHSPRVRQEVENMRRWLTGLDGLRESILGDSVPPRAAIRTYSTMIDVLENLQDELGQVGDDDILLKDVAALGALQRAKEEVSRQQVILVVALVERKLDYDDLSDFLGSWNAQQAELATFEQEAQAKYASLYTDTLKGPAIDRADAMRQRALAQLREYKEIRDLDITATPRRELLFWYDSTTLTVNAMRKVEDSLATAVVTKTRELSDTEQRNAIISGALILVLLLLVLVITTRVAGSLVRPLRRLRAEALQVATTRLPETVRVLRESGDGAATPEVPSVGVNTRDEIGEVARAFDEVHREAIRLAGDEAKLRANVNSMFVNLSRRSQTLVERQLQLIEGLEQGEEDENRLANLFRLDHLATRMRRNSENLLVLAGQEAARKWSEPVPLVDIARASLSEVENYERVQIQIPSDIQIVGPAVTDAVHLLAELIENAISFSPRESRVSVTSAPADGGFVVTISDLGIGMSGDELAEANWRLANPPVVDVSVSRRMGLFVVGRLALRHGIRVQLRMRETGGLSALVMLPDMLVAAANGMVPQQRGQYDSFTTFDPAMLGSPPYANPDTPEVRAHESLADTQWPGSMPVPDTGGWTPYGEEPSPSGQPPYADAPGDQAPAAFGEQPPFGEQQPFADQQPFTDQQPSAGQPFAGQAPFAGESPFAEQSPEASWPSFAEQPPPLAADQRWPSFAEEPPPLEVDQRWPSFGEESNWPSVASSTPNGNGSGNGLFTPYNTDYASQDLTGPLPVVDSSPMESEGEDFLPIFSSVGSDWFRRPEPDPLKAQEPPADPELPGPSTGAFGPVGQGGYTGAPGSASDGFSGPGTGAFGAVGNSPAYDSFEADSPPTMPHPVISADGPPPVSGYGQGPGYGQGAGHAGPGGHADSQGGYAGAGQGGSGGQPGYTGTGGPSGAHGSDYAGSPGSDYAGAGAPGTGHGGAGHGGPGDAGSGYGGPGNAGSGYGGSGHAGSGHAGPGYAGAGSGHAGPGAGGPGAGGPGAGGPGAGSGGPGAGPGAGGAGADGSGQAGGVGKSGLPQRRPGQSGAGASWTSPADSGFQAAQAAAEPARGGTTASGLPRRVPKANLVPGTAGSAEPPMTSPAPPISPERLRSRLSSFQQGVRQGREDLKEKE